MDTFTLNDESEAEILALMFMSRYVFLTCQRFVELLVLDVQILKVHFNIITTFQDSNFIIYTVHVSLLV